MRERACCLVCGWPSSCCWILFPHCTSGHTKEHASPCARQATAQKSWGFWRQGSANTLGSHWTSAPEGSAFGQDASEACPMVSEAPTPGLQPPIMLRDWWVLPSSAVVFQNLLTHQWLALHPCLRLCLGWAGPNSEQFSNLKPISRHEDSLDQLIYFLHLKQNLF